MFNPYFPIVEPPYQKQLPQQASNNHSVVRPNCFYHNMKFRNVAKHQMSGKLHTNTDEGSTTNANHAKQKTQKTRSPCKSRS